MKRIPLVKNPSIGNNEAWITDGILYRELIRQEYENMVIAAGVIEGDPVEDVFLRTEKTDGDGSMWCLKVDELAAIAWAASGVLWSLTIADREHYDAERELKPEWGWCKHCKTLPAGSVGGLCDECRPLAFEQTLQNAQKDAGC